VICFTGYGVIAEKPCISHSGRIFPCTLYEKLYVGSKNHCQLFDGLDVLDHHAKFGEDCTTGASCRCKNVVFVCFFVFCNTLRLACCSFKGVYIEQVCIAVYWSISMLFSAFFRMDSPFRWAR